MKRRIIAILTCLAILLSALYFMPDSYAGIQTLNLSKQEKSIKVGESFQLTMTGVKASTIKWKSSKPNIADVTKKGVVRGLSTGTTSITGKYKSLKFSIKVTVKAKDTQTSKPSKGDQLIYSDEKAELYYSGQSEKWDGTNQINFKIINKLDKTSNWAFRVIYINGQNIPHNEFDTAMVNMECSLQVDIPKGVTPKTVKGILYAFQEGSTVYEKEFEYTIK